MSRFFLHIHKNAPLEHDKLSSIAEKLTHFPWVSSSTYTENNLQLASTINKSDSMRIFKDPLRGTTFLLQGNIFESTRGMEKIDEATEEFGIESQLIKRYREKGISGCVGLNGIYNLIVWDHKSHTLETACDRLGLFQVLYARLDDKRFVLTTDILTLKSVPGYTPRIDKGGIFDILYMGVAFESRTILRDVIRLLPNACYQITNEGLRLLETYRLPFSKNGWDKPLAQHLKDLEHLYLSAIRRQLDPKQKLLYLQSGGKDSRLFSFLLKKAGITPSCATIGDNHHSEVFLARRLNKVLDFPWKRIPLIPEFYYLYAEPYFGITSFSNRIFMSFQIDVLPGISNSYDYILSTLHADPLLGSALTAGQFKKGDSSREAFEAYQEFWRPGLLSDEAIEKIIGPDAPEMAQEYRKEAYDIFCQSADEPYQMRTAYELRTNSRFKVGDLMNCFYSVCPTRSVILDNDFMDFAFSLPFELLYERRIVDIYLIENAKSLASIPFDANTRKCRPLTHSLKENLFYKTWLFYNENIVLPFLSLANPVKATTRAYVQSFSLHDKGFQRVRARAYDLLPSLDGILDKSAVRDYLNKPLPETQDHIMPGNDIRALVTIIWAINKFVGGDER